MIDLTKIKTIAVIGASNKAEKFGYKIVKNLAARGFTVWPVNPREETIAGLRAYKNINDLPAVPDLVDVVVPVGVGLEVIKEAIEFGVNKIWVQPGAESREIKTLLSASGVEFVTGDCIMVN